MLKIKRALISVSDKTGIIGFAAFLASAGVEIISTGGTAKVLKDAGVPVIEMSDYTGFPEMLDGRVKTLHPKIHAGLLSLRDNPAHMETMKKHHIGLIDMVVVNLYPFEATVRKKGVTLEEAVENIDIGGPSMLRSAAKNWRSVAVVCSPDSYPKIIDEMRAQGGAVSGELLRRLGLDVFRLTSSYDAAIAEFLGKSFGGKTLPDSLCLKLSKVSGLRYGENPHQQACLYEEASPSPFSLIKSRQLHGKELSFNNYLDLDAAYAIVSGFSDPAVCVVKHSNPTGVATASSLKKALEDAWATDPLSAFGGIIGLNGRVDLKTAAAIVERGFIECVLAPGFDGAALDLLKTKKNLRLLEIGFSKEKMEPSLDFKRIRGGFLVQEFDERDISVSDLRVVTKKKPTKAQLSSLLFAWKVVRHVKSNAIVLAKNTKTVGVGMGQTSRVDSVALAVRRAGSRARGSILASDAFFPKPDNIAVAKKAGVCALIQPGGSIADPEIIKAADSAGMSMVFTGVRHFKH